MQRVIAALDAVCAAGTPVQVASAVARAYVIAREMADAQPRWTIEPPTEPGWYWVASTLVPRAAPRLVECFWRGDQFRYRAMMSTYSGHATTDPECATWLRIPPPTREEIPQ